jgi:hypothetical protein
VWSPPQKRGGLVRVVEEVVVAARPLQEVVEVVGWATVLSVFLFVFKTVYRQPYVITTHLCSELELQLKTNRSLL